jgi:serine/threonine-protein kinase
LQIGALVAKRYRLVRQIGKGGMGSVFEATDENLGTRLALKIMRAPESGEEAERERIGRFQREAVVVGKLDTPHIVRVHDAGTDPVTNEPFIAMELLEGEDASQLLKRVGPLRPELAAAVLAQACAGLAKAHEAGIIHRDIKPGNLFLARAAGGDRIVKVLDFGVAKVRKVGDPLHAEGHTLTQTGALVGSPHYMSPEQARGRKTIDHRADVWSLGILLHKLVAGRTPFDAATTLGEVIIAVCSETPRSLLESAPWAPPLLAEVVRRALQKDPAARFQTTIEMLDALRPLLPQGFAIHDAMLVGLPPELRAQVSVPPASDGSLSAGSYEQDDAPTSAREPALPMAAAPIDSGAGLAATRHEPATNPRRYGVLLGAFAVLAIVGAGLGVVAFRRSAVVKASAATTTSALPPPAPVESTAPVLAASTAEPPPPSTGTAIAVHAPTSTPTGKAHPVATAARPVTSAGKPPQPGRLSGGVGSDVPF